MKIHPGKLVLDRPGCVSVLALAFVSVLASSYLNMEAIDWLNKSIVWVSL